MASLTSAMPDPVLQNTNSTTAVAVDPSSLSSFYLFKRVVLPVIAVIPGFLYWTVTFVTITLPSWLFTLFSTSLTFTLNFTTILFMFGAFASAVIWIVRYRYLNMYSRLPPQPARKEPQVDIFPDAIEGDSKQGFSNYLDGFLSAIKVFGYLERPVFHELTRTMQTRKLIAGETLLLEEEDGFCLVVDGLVQIFVKSYREGGETAHERSQHGSHLDEDDGMDAKGSQGYQLLTEVKNGASMSSLFSILALFTEDVKLRHDEEENMIDSGNLENSQHFGSTNGDHEHTRASSVSDSPGSIPNPISPRRTSVGGVRASTISIAPGSRGLPAIPPLSLDPGVENRRDSKNATNGTDEGRKAESAHPDILARATVDTTIAIIPATAFRRLTRIYPKATAHIVQVILTRLQRVTLDTGHAYLGLTSDVLRTEKLMNKFTTYDLPGFLRGSALERLKEKFNKERERTGSEHDTQGIALHNPYAGQRRNPGSSLKKEKLNADGASNPEKSQVQRRAGPSRQNLNPDQSGISAGDLLTNLQILRAGGRASQLSYSQPLETAEFIHRDAQSPLDYGSRNPFKPAGKSRPPLQHQESRDEDMLFRESILTCLFKAIGLTDVRNIFPRADSSEQSPMLVSYDSRRQRAVFNNIFGLVDPYEGTTDNTDTDSVNSASASLPDVNIPPPIADELIGDVEIVFFPKGSVLVEQGERNPGLYYVIDGFLDVSVPYDEHDSGPNAVQQAESILSDPKTLYGDGKPGGKKHDSRSQHKESAKRKRVRSSLFLIKPGGLAGYLGTVSSYRSFVDVTAKTDVYVGFLARRSIERIVEKYPVVLLTMAKRLTTLLPRLILHIDFALEWMQINAGQAIFNRGEDSDAIYIVLNGRLRATQESDDGKVKSVAEYGQGDSVGELEVLTESTRTCSLHAIRDTELARFPKTLFNSLAFEHPGITIKISKIIASRMRALVDNPLNDSVKNSSLAVRNANSTTNLRTVAILPVTAGIPVVEFSRRLLIALSQLGTSRAATSLNQSAILDHLGRHAFSRMGKLKLSQYLADLEEKYGLVLYVADTPVRSPWTHTCISQADCILLVGLAEGSPEIGEYERYLLTTKTTVRKELVLLHAERYCPPGLTRQWLRNRMWINGSHYHIQMAFRSSPEPVLSQQRRLRAALKQRVQTLSAGIQKYTSLKVEETPLYSSETPLKGDFHRLARRLCGKSVGLVLGGGGARGIAHVGVIRSLEEAGIPIDIVGGTSIGAFIGALYAWDANMVPMYGRAKKFASRMGSMWRFALDLTYPALSYTTGHEFNRGVFKTFGNSQIEDFWLEFYCNTTNISKSRADYHSGGYVWRYVRASMTLAGLVPPLCDEGNLLLDGGYIDNLTVSHMKALGADVIFAVDVGAIDDYLPQKYDDSLSGFWVLMKRLNPFGSGPAPPTIGEVQGRLAYVSSVDALERAKTMPSCRYMMPPVQAYGTLEFGNFDKIYDVGYQFGKKYLAQLREEGVLPMIEETEEKKNLRRTMAPRRASI